MPVDDEKTPVQVRLVPSRLHNKLRTIYVLIVIATVLGLAVWRIQTAVDQSDRKATRMNFATIALSLVNYSETFGHLPRPVRKALGEQVIKNGSENRTGQPLYSWRVDIVPYLQAWHGSWNQSKPWDDPTNKQLVELSSFYAYSATEPEGHPQSFPEANALALTGPGTAFGDGKEPSRALTDIPPSTILVVETRASGVPWPAPGDFDIRTIPHTINAPDGKGISSRSEAGFHLIFADGQVWFLSNNVPFESLEKFFTTTEAKKHDREKLLGPFALHRGP